MTFSCFDAADYVTGGTHCHLEKMVNLPYGDAVNLLLIEDEEDVADVLARAFREDGHETVVAYTGEDGLTCLRHRRPDAVVLDIRLPKMSGIEVLRAIRSTDQALPVIILTGLARPSEIAEARELGVTEIIEKSYVLKHFGEALARVVRAAPPDSGR